ncbi:unnamed protein product [Diamesa tonsa]
MKCLVLLVLMINLVLAKQYERCQLAEELYYKHNVTLKEIGMLVCFAETRSNLDTESLDNGNYGLLKFNSRAWCSITDEVGGNCNVKCDDFIDDDITDDIKCAKQIILAEGLDAWGLTTECQETSERIIEDSRELSQKHNVALEDVGMLVCIAEEGSNLDTNKTNSIAYGLFQLHNKFWCLQNEIGGGCIMKCNDLIDDDITDDVKCVKRILLVEGFDAWGKKTSCVPTSKAVIKQCFSNELNSSENESHNGTLIVEFVDLMIESIKSFGTGSKLNSNNHPTINNYFVFNINGNQVKKIKLVSDKTQQHSTQSP